MSIFDSTTFKVAAASSAITAILAWGEAFRYTALLIGFEYGICDVTPCQLSDFVAPCVGAVSIALAISFVAVLCLRKGNKLAKQERKAHLKLWDNILREKEQ